MHIVFRYEPRPISYQKLVEFYKERQKLSLTNKNKFPKKKIPTIFYWCQQDEWEKVFKEQVESKFSILKKKAWADQVKSFKSSNTYKSFPVSVRPKTPDINEINLNSKNNKVIFKALYDWRQNFSNLLPREKKPIHEIAREDLEKFKMSDLWKRYEKARGNFLVEKIQKPDHGHIKT